MQRRLTGHRAVHGGAEIREAVRVTADVEAAIEAASILLRCKQLSKRQSESTSF